MTDEQEIVIRFIRAVANVNTRRTIYDDRGRAYAEECAPFWIRELVDAAKAAVEEIEKQEAHEP